MPRALAQVVARVRASSKSIVKSAAIVWAVEAIVATESIVLTRWPVGIEQTEHPSLRPRGGVSASDSARLRRQVGGDGPVVGLAGDGPARNPSVATLGDRPAGCLGSC